jgi:hypothetical protein
VFTFRNRELYSSALQDMVVEAEQWQGGDASSRYASMDEVFSAAAVVVVVVVVVCCYYFRFCWCCCCLFDFFRTCAKSRVVDVHGPLNSD